MGMTSRKSDYLTGMVTNDHFGRTQMAKFLRRQSATAGSANGQNAPKKPTCEKQLSDATHSQNIAEAQTGNAPDIIDLIGATRNRFEKMIAVVRKKRPRHIKASIPNAAELEPLTGGIAHTFSNLFMAIQGRISLMLLRSGPAHPFFAQLRRMEKLVQCESILANDLLPHIAGRFCPLDPLSRRRLLDQVAQIPSQLDVKYRLIDAPADDDRNPTLRSTDFQKLTVAATCILNLLLSEIHQLTVFMMSQTGSDHSDFGRLLGIKAYVQKGFDRIHDLYECTGMTAGDAMPTRPQKLVEIVFDAFFGIKSSLRLQVSVAGDLWDIKADARQVQKIVQELDELAVSNRGKGGYLHITAANACNLEGDVKTTCEQGYVVMSIGVSNGSPRPGRTVRWKPSSVKRKIKIEPENQIQLEEIGGLVRALGGRLSTICPPRAGIAFNVFLPAVPEPGAPEQSRLPADASRQVIYLKSDKKPQPVEANLEPCVVYLKSACAKQDKAMPSSL